MIRLKQLLIDCEIAQEVFALQLGLSRMTAVKVLTRGYLPKRTGSREILMARIKAWVENTPAALDWLEENRMSVSDIWGAYDGQIRENIGFPGVRLELADPLKLNPRKDIDMISGSTLKHFKMFKSPFLNDVTSEKDIYLSSEHRFLKEMMLDSAKYGGFIAVVGGVGSGKSVMRKAVAAELLSEGIKVVMPLIIDKSRVTPSSLVDAIIMDISDEYPKNSLERKTRQAVQLLKARAENGMRQVLMIEEAHTIDKRAFKALKQIYEMEIGFEKLIGIILIGQPELLKKLDEVGNSDIREVIRRITTAEIEGLGDAVRPYLEHKFARIGKAKIGDVLADDVYEAINKRLERLSGRRTVNRSFPLSVNNLVVRAMNMAARAGEEKVTADIIMNC
ncbi:AAA family ATPase [uncultured Desulfobacter sp.]|uniref:ExeA family protein n=1 Tax=uncultured Desulfobacter sp. TaxID=240139 RepID=UPI002AABD5F2|nr:AAA family ATPase [uncultured Desulfobacter sp.]